MHTASCIFRPAFGCCAPQTQVETVIFKFRIKQYFDDVLIGIFDDFESMLLFSLITLYKLGEGGNLDS